VRGECRRAAQAITALVTPLPAPAAKTTEKPVPADDLRRRIQVEASAARGSTGVVTAVAAVAGRLRDVQVPARVAEAMVAAVAEALRNVGRHAGVERAEVTLATAGHAGLLITVADQGRGLRPGTVAGFGLRQSVSQRLHEVGGEAHIESAPGNGTRVTLSWVPPTPELNSSSTDTEPELTRIPLHPRALAAAFTSTLMFGAFYLALRYPAAGGPRWGEAAVSGALLAYATWCVIAVPWPTVLRYTHWVGLVVLPGLLAAGLHIAGPGSLRGFESWIVGMCGIPVVLLAMLRPAGQVLALAALESGIVAVAAVLDPSLGPLDVLAPITQTLMFVVLVVYGNGAIKRVRRSADDQEQVVSTALAERQEMAVRQRILGSHFEWLRTDVRPFLEAVAAEDINPGDQTAQERAKTLALAVRDELAVPAQLPEPVRRHIARARQHGIRVRVRATDLWAPGLPDGRLDGLLDLLSGDPDLSDITLSLPKPSSPLRVVVRPRLSTRQHAALALLGSGTVEIDEDDLASIITVHPIRSEYA
jgi:hypothetical protein